MITVPSLVASISCSAVRPVLASGLRSIDASCCYDSVTGVGIIRSIAIAFKFSPTYPSVVSQEPRIGGRNDLGMVIGNER